MQRDMRPFTFDRRTLGCLKGICACAVLLLSSVAEPLAQTRKGSIKVTASGSGEKASVSIKIPTTSKETPKVFVVENPLRIVVDIPGLSSRRNETIAGVKSGSISRIRVGSHSDKLRVVADLSGTSVPKYSVRSGNGFVELVVSKGAINDKSGAVEAPLSETSPAAELTPAAKPPGAATPTVIVTQPRPTSPAQESKLPTPAPTVSTTHRTNVPAAAATSDTGSKEHVSPSPTVEEKAIPPTPKPGKKTPTPKVSPTPSIAPSHSGDAAVAPESTSTVAAQKSQSPKAADAPETPSTALKEVSTEPTQKPKGKTPTPPTGKKVVTESNDLEQQTIEPTPKPDKETPTAKPAATERLNPEMQEEVVEPAVTPKKSIPTPKPTATATALPPEPTAVSVDVPILGRSVSRSPSETTQPAAKGNGASTSIVADGKSQLWTLREVVFDKLPPAKTPLLKLILSRGHAQVQIAKVDQKTYKLTIQNSRIGGQHLTLPQFPPADFEGFTVVAIKQTGSNVEVTIGVEPGTTLGTFVRQSEIWTKKL